MELLNIAIALIIVWYELVLGVGVVGGLLYCAFWASSHPLAKYPGPFLARFTNAYAAYHAWKGDLHIDMWRCHLKYGDIVRYGPNRLLINTSTGMRDIYANGKNTIKCKAYEALVHRAPNTLTLRNKKEAARRRRIMSQGLSDGSLRTYEPLIIAHANKFCQRLQEGDANFNKNEKSQQSITSPGEWTPTRNMSSWCNFVAFDIMVDIVFSLKYDLLGSPKHRYVVDAIEGSNVRTSVLLYAPQLVIGKIDRWMFPEAIKERNKFIRFITKIVYERVKATTPTHRDIFASLASAKDPETGKRLEMQEIGAESTTLIVAGSDTSSTTLAGMFFYLTRYPYAYYKVCQEVRSTFSSVDEIVLGKDLTSCVYLRACLDESMRMSPPVGGSLFREVGQGGLTVGGEYIPAGCEVGTGIYSIHHNPDYFPDPFRFRPERWIVDKDVTREQVDAAQAAYTPFSFGPRGCVGKGLAIVEIMLTMARVLYTLDFRVAEGAAGKVGGGNLAAELGRRNPFEYQMRDHITSSKDGPMVQFRLR